ncbi:MAG: sn-glycerol-3-phosphate ABC transporter ATP-binding protein UgpC [Pseudomonadota bacterium]
MTSQHTQISIAGLDRSFGSFKALHNINLDIPRGKFVALVGPSGCGKSTLLRTIAGLGKPSSGTIRIDGNLVNDAPPRERDVAMVFQSYALYPHMTVAKNITYSLRIKRVDRATIQAKLAEAARIVGLEDLLQRYPKELSGGQRQRVAMARAIVRNPAVFLFDEPLSNLDAALRVRMRSQIRDLHDRLGATSVYVTHDQIEAMTMADIVVVMRNGVVEQIGAPLELYDRPANTFVGGFIGSPAMNFLSAKVDQLGTAATTRTGANFPFSKPLDAGRAVKIGLRPEHLSLTHGAERDNGEFELEATVAALEATGNATYADCRIGSDVLTIVLHGRPSLRPGQKIKLRAAQCDVHVFDEKSGAHL